MLFAWLKPKHPQNREALGFLQALALDAVLPFTVLAAPGRNGMEIATMNLRSEEARAWIAKRAARKVYVLTAQTGAPLRGRAISESDLACSRIVGVAIPAAQRRALDAFHPAPSIVAETPRGFALAWRLRNPTAPSKARELAGRIAAHLGGSPLDHLFPLPGCGNARLLQHLKGSHHWALVTDFDFALGNGAVTETAASEPLVTAAANITMRPVPWLWPFVIALSSKDDGGCYYLLGGEGGMGKSTLAALIAAIVTQGAEWPDGSGKAPCGSVAIGELEDAPSSAMLPRLRAANADLSKVHFVKHVDLSKDIAKLDAALAHVADLRLLILSPFLEFIGEGSNDAQAVLARLRPLKEFAAQRGAAVIGIMHPKDEGGSYDLFSGPKAVRTNSRGTYALAADPADDNPTIRARRRMMIDGKVNNAPDGRARYYRIEGVELPGGISTSRVVFLPLTLPPKGEARGEGETPAPSTAKRTMGAAAVRSWLSEQLTDGPQDGAALKIAAAAAGVSIPSLYRAADTLGVIREAIDGTPRKLWRLHNAV